MCPLGKLKELSATNRALGRGRAISLLTNVSKIPPLIKIRGKSMAERFCCLINKNRTKKTTHRAVAGGLASFVSWLMIAVRAGVWSSFTAA
ncbi:hypothetical protein [Xylocopilactobacillus apicola]|uniref:hypothetical protein n=1 Tax=Xylocopilactobacillus apicola TaxID=2932184 RepID=UPI0029544BF8|nr:hypothetical protein [Xylocopilactobacillus apicola]